jgi:hypothetical protein
VADVSILDPSIHAAPKSYTIQGAQELVLKGVTASFDGTSASGSWIPAVQIIDPSGNVIGTYTSASVLAAGALADVSWFPGVGNSSGASVAGTQSFAPPLDTPDAGGFTFPALSTANGFTNVRRVLPYFNHGGSGTWRGTIRVPPNFTSSPTLTVTAVTTATTGAVRWIVGTAVVGNGVSEDTNYTTETAQNVTVPGVALRRFDTVFGLSTAAVAGADLNFAVTRDGGNVADTCTGSVAVWTVTFGFVGS